MAKTALEKRRPTYGKHENIVFVDCCFLSKSKASLLHSVSTGQSTYYTNTMLFVNKVSAIIKYCRTHEMSRICVSRRHKHLSNTTEDQVFHH